MFKSLRQLFVKFKLPLLRDHAEVNRESDFIRKYLIISRSLVGPTGSAENAENRPIQLRLTVFTGPSLTPEHSHGLFPLAWPASAAQRHAVVWSLVSLTHSCQYFHLTDVSALFAGCFLRPCQSWICRAEPNISCYCVLTLKAFHWQSARGNTETVM